MLLAGASNASNAQMLEPPDTNIAVSGDWVVEMVNTFMMTYNRSTRVTMTFDLHTWFGADTAPTDATDPQVYWDPASQRFIASILHL